VFLSVSEKINKWWVNKHCIINVFIFFRFQKVVQSGLIYRLDLKINGIFHLASEPLMENMW